MKVGSVVYACAQGLGYLAKAFYDHGIINDVVVVDRASIRNRPFQRDWFPLADIALSSKGNLGRQISLKGQQMVDRVDVLLFFETPFDWGLITYAHQTGKKVALMPMHECMPRALPARPDLMMCPSLLEVDCYVEQEIQGPPYPPPFERYKGRDGKTGVMFTPVPTDLKATPWKQRNEARTFVHNGGHGGLRNRNGTGELLDAIKLCKSDARFIIRSQKPLMWHMVDSRVKVVEGTVPWSELYQEGDVYLHPTKFDALSMPIQEAFASGMPVMTGDRFPMNTWLPTDLLIPIKGYTKQSISPSCLEFDEAGYDPQDIANMIDNLYGKDISSYSLWGRNWAEDNSWDVLGPKYLKVLEQLCGSST